MTTDIEPSEITYPIDVSGELLVGGVFYAVSLRWSKTTGLRLRYEPVALLEDGDE